MSNVGINTGQGKVFPSARRGRKICSDLDEGFLREDSASVSGLSLILACSCTVFQTGKMNTGFSKSQ